MNTINHLVNKLNNITCYNTSNIILLKKIETEIINQINHILSNYFEEDF